ncbi:hypothetical protein BDY21DRAFT_143126 [Lineolata rhizophorae]|uniref:Uncharacterized protein n=1 Tax=Lineolata rhizophorae TaxID=578093 RepID=A0A6A6NN78_9PEZI|nr:hypothetical protein BDY21DRAFT_143126 [Lineolata rhizophorae]
MMPGCAPLSIESRVPVLRQAGATTGRAVAGQHSHRGLFQLRVAMGRSGGSIWRCGNQRSLGSLPGPLQPILGRETNTPVSAPLVGCAALRFMRGEPGCRGILIGSGAKISDPRGCNADELRSSREKSANEEQVSEPARWHKNLRKLSFESVCAA